VFIAGVLINAGKLKASTATGALRNIKSDMHVSTRGFVAF
jgi:hypothetical protein